MTFQLELYLPTMKRKMSPELILLNLIFISFSTSVMTLSDSSFSVKIEDDIPVESCSKILSNLEVSF